MAASRNRTFGAWIRRPEAIIGLCAVVVSVVAVMVAAYEAHIQREWQRAAVWPYVQLGRSFYYTESSATPGTREWRLTINAENVGVGPAHIRDFHVTVDGKPQPSWGAAMQALLNTKDEIRYGQSTILGMIVPPQRSVQMFQYVNQPYGEKIYREMGRLDYSACFCSVFGECWVTTDKSREAEHVEACEVDKDSFTE